MSGLHYYTHMLSVMSKHAFLTFVKYFGLSDWIKSTILPEHCGFIHFYSFCWSPYTLECQYNYL